MLAGALRLDRAEEARSARRGRAQLERVGLGAQSARTAPATCRSASSASLEIARALAADPVLLLLDEPAAGLRLPRSRRSPTCCARCAREGVTILLVEHDMDFVMGLVDRLVVMDFGEKLAEGTPADDPRRSRACRRPISAGVGVSRRSLERRRTCTSAYGKVEAVRGVSSTLQRRRRSSR